MPRAVVIAEFIDGRAAYLRHRETVPGDRKSRAVSNLVSGGPPQGLAGF
jgi:hypothetical protein